MLGVTAASIGPSCVGCVAATLTPSLSIRTASRSSSITAPCARTKRCDFSCPGRASCRSETRACRTALHHEDNTDIRDAESASTHWTEVSGLKEEFRATASNLLDASRIQVWEGAAFHCTLPGEADDLSPAENRI